MEDHFEKRGEWKLEGVSPQKRERERQRETGERLMARPYGGIGDHRERERKRESEYMADRDNRSTVGL